MKDMIATVSEDQTLKIWKAEFDPALKNKQPANWVLSFRHQFNEPVWRCSWSPVGFMLAVSCGDNKTRVF
jgi:protein transport protein SEC13